MIAIPLQGEFLRRTVRTLLVAATAATALAMSLPNLYSSVHPASGGFDFSTEANVVVDAGPRAKAAGIAVGDRVDYPSMRPDQRYGDPRDGLRLGPMGKKIAFLLDRGGEKRIAIVAPEVPQLGGFDNLSKLVLIKAGFLVLVLIGSALLLIGPSRLSTAFFLVAVGHARVLPIFYSFSPAWLYAIIMAANDALAALGPVGFLLLALYLGENKIAHWRWVPWLATAAFVAIFLPVAASDAQELLLGTRPPWPILGWESFAVLTCCYIAGIALFLTTTVRASTGLWVRLAAVLLATVGILILWQAYGNAHSAAWYFANLPGVAVTRALSDAAFRYGDWGFGARLAASLIVAYLIVRGRVVDTGPVISRIVAYVIITLIVVALLAMANVAFTAQFARYPMAIPLELFLALGIGYRLSGLRDVAGALSLATVDAWNAWGMGRLAEEHDALTRALGLAERTRQQGLISEVRAHFAFSSWRRGDDGEFERHIAPLARMLGTRSLRGLDGFVRAAISDDGELAFEASDLPEWKARAALVACGRTKDARRAEELAREALLAADLADLPSLQVLALVAAAETSPTQRGASLEKAQQIARDAGWSALSKSALALRADARDIGLLASFVDIRIRKTRPARAMVEISFFNAEVWANGVRLALPEKELELLLTVASKPSAINDIELIDSLWPEADGDAARNAFRVCLHRLRKGAGDSRIVLRVGKGYALHPWADVDLWKLQAALDACANGNGKEHLDDLRQLCAAVRAGQARRATLGQWFYRFEQMLSRMVDEAKLVDDAVAPEMSLRLT